MAHLTCRPEDRAVAAQDDGQIGLHRRHIFGAVKSQHDLAVFSDCRHAAASPRPRHAADRPRQAGLPAAGCCWDWFMFLAPLPLAASKGGRGSCRADSGSCASTARQEPCPPGHVASRWRHAGSRAVCRAWSRGGFLLRQVDDRLLQCPRHRARVGEQFAAVAVFDELVGNAQAADAAGVECRHRRRLPARRCRTRPSRRLPRP